MIERTLVIRCGKRGMKYSTHLEPNHWALFWRVWPLHHFMSQSFQNMGHWRVLGSFIGIRMSHYKDPYRPTSISWFMPYQGFFLRKIAHLGATCLQQQNSPCWRSPLFAAMYIKGILAANQLMPPIRQGGVGRGHDSIYRVEIWPQLAQFMFGHLYMGL